MSRGLAATGRALGRQALAIRKGYLAVEADSALDLADPDPQKRAFAKFRQGEALKGLSALDKLAANVYGLGKDLESVSATPFADTIRGASVPVFTNILGNAAAHLDLIADKPALWRRVTQGGNMSHQQHMGGDHMDGLGTWYLPWTWASDAAGALADAAGSAAQGAADTAKSTIVDVALIGFSAWAVVKLLSGKK